jgi:hypothetical protein
MVAFQGIHHGPRRSRCAAGRVRHLGRVQTILDDYLRNVRPREQEQLAPGRVVHPAPPPKALREAGPAIRSLVLLITDGDPQPAGSVASEARRGHTAVTRDAGHRRHRASVRRRAHALRSLPPAGLVDGPVDGVSRCRHAVLVDVGRRVVSRAPTGLSTRRRRIISPGPRVRDGTRHGGRR